MDKHIQNIILDRTNATAIKKIENIQSLWSGYGEIIKCFLKDSKYPSVVIKHIKLPKVKEHPRGWNTDLSHLRKLKSYNVETEFYKSWSSFCNTHCYIPNCIYIENMETEALIILEDLDDSGFSVRKTTGNLKDIKLCLTWLAHFHAAFMGQEPNGLWEVGTYWHLETRPDELNRLDDLPLKNAAKIIDSKLNNCKFKTFVHGDAKLANFCFSKNSSKVSAVDFQYTGGGSGIKDVVYFLGSCLYEDDCEKLETELLDFYFEKLALALNKKNTIFNTTEIIKEWRKLYPIAWTDFHRFIKGWSPGHWKINSYSERLAQEVIFELTNK